jgi:hypothetical protein
VTLCMRVVPSNSPKARVWPSGEKARLDTEEAVPQRASWVRREILSGEIVATGLGTGVPAKTGPGKGVGVPVGGIAVGELVGITAVFVAVGGWRVSVGAGRSFASEVGVWVEMVVSINAMGVACRKEYNVEHPLVMKIASPRNTERPGAQAELHFLRRLLGLFNIRFFTKITEMEDWYRPAISW